VRRFHGKLKRRVLVNLKSGTVIAGVLYRVTPTLVELREATLVAGVPQAIDGEALIERRDVDFYQVLPPAPPAVASVRGIEAVT
jgi:hypothetical protein